MNRAQRRAAARCKHNRQQKVMNGHLWEICLVHGCGYEKDLGEHGEMKVYR
jgi:hypothetical protein